jgi:hypothetical protein
MARKVSLNVNGNSIELNPFVEAYVYHVAAGIVNSLKGTGSVKTLELDIDSDKRVTLTLNGTGVPVNEFVMQIIFNTMAGMVKDLKGVTEAMSTFSLMASQD